MAVHFPPLPAPLSALSSSEILLLLPLLLLPTYIIYNRLFRASPFTTSASSSSGGNSDNSTSDGTANDKKEVKSVMQPPHPNLAPARNDPFTLADLKKYDGSDPDGKIYVAIKGTYPISYTSSSCLSCSNSSYRLSGTHHTYILTHTSGTVFDVTRKRDMYGKGKSYNLLAGTDGSRALGLSSLSPIDAVPDWSTLDAEQRRVLDEWHEFFE